MSQTITVANQYYSAAGTVDLIDINGLVDLLYNKHARKFMDVIGDMAIDMHVLGQDPNSMSNVERYVEMVVLTKDESSADMFDSAMFAGYGTGGYGEDMSYKRVRIPLEPVNEDIKLFMLNKLLAMFTAYRLPHEMETQEVYECACNNAMENFINPTHAVKVRPRVVAAIDIEELKVKVVNDHGTIKMAIYSDKPIMMKAVEALNELDF